MINTLAANIGFRAAGEWRMRVLGIVSSPTDLKWAILEGGRPRPVVVPLESIAQKLPKHETEGQALLTLRLLLSTFLPEKKVGRICVIRAGGSKHGHPSPPRVKAEGIIQLVGAELEIPVDLVAPQSLRAEEKRFAGITSGSPEEKLNGGLPFRPKAARDAALVAWWGLEQ